MTNIITEQKHTKNININTSGLKVLDETKLRKILSKAGEIYSEYAELEKTIGILEDTSANIDDFHGKKIALIKEEARWRLIIDEILNRTKKGITPREFSILYLHYIEYKSWSDIACTLNIDRRYALQIHKTAIMKILDMVKFTS